MSTKILNDPIYGFITVPHPLLLRLIDHPWFQRLRYIKQLGLSHLVYPGALHTRFHHALGAMHLMGEAIATLRSKGHVITEEEALGARIAILLHDVGHGPFSHALEHSLVEGIGHEAVSALVMDALNDEFAGALTLGIRIFRDEHPKRFLLTGSYTHEQGYEMNERLRKKYAEIKEKEQRWEAEQVEDAEVVVVAFGIHGRMCKDLVANLRAQGKKAGFIRPITLWPFPDKAFANLPSSVKSVLVVEMNHGQMIDDVRLAVNGKVPVHFLGKTGGDTPMCTLADMTREANTLFGA